MSHTDLWARVEPLLARVERPARYIDGEWGAVHKPDAAYRAALIYPDTYELGQANQAIGIIYHILNGLPDVAAERCYLPAVDMADLMRAEQIPLFSLETCSAIRDFDFVGITLPYELTYTNVLEALDLAGIPLRAAERGSGDPLVIGGGPGAFNPEPVAPFFDAILVGEGEDACSEIVETHREALAEGYSREEAVRRLALIDGVYVPSLYEPRVADDGRFAGVRVLDPDAPSVVFKRVLSTLAAHPTPECPVVPFMDVVHDRAGVEILRGCTRGCRFCQAGMVYRPVRERSADDIVRSAITSLKCTGYNEVSLTSLSSADHSMLEEVLQRLTRRLAGTGVSVSLPSLRVDAFSVEMARLVGAAKRSGLTFAPEAGTQRLRDVINKNVTEEDLLRTVRRAFESGWRRVKLYFMLGLPTETDEDLKGIGELVSKVLDEARAATPGPQRSSVRVAVSVSTFVPKASTPFQWEGQVGLEEVLRRQSLVREYMPRKGVELSWHDAQTSFLEGLIARGGREVADVIEAAWRRGARFDAWTEQFSFSRWLDAIAEAGVDAQQVTERSRPTDEPLPWEHISAGLSKRYLLRERERALSGVVTPDCSFVGCTGCDVCDELGVDVVVAGGERR